MHAALTSSLRAQLELVFVKLITKTLYLTNVQTNVSIILPMRHLPESKYFGKRIPGYQNSLSAILNVLPFNFFN